ncbi:MAG TPA: polyprenyl synthetase family protein [Opitutaceae bacterium]|nr:polyprenyl synthetase family protein [Opitutaceae bacterium]
MNSGSLAALEVLLREQVGSFEPEVRDLAAYCLGTSGKRLRPLLVFLSGWEGEGKVNPDLVKAAAVIEMVHMATLVHDDIMDGAAIRRGRATVSERDGPSVAVLLGDALFSQAVVLSTQFPDVFVSRRIAEATRRVCSGEIIQTLGSSGGAPDRSRYERVIDLKTAELFSVSCELGSALSGARPARVSSIAAFGRHLGVAYQVYDDLADFAGDASVIGKTLGTDWKSGKLTLPVLELLDRMPRGSSPEVLAALGSGDPGKLERVKREMHELGALKAVLVRIHIELTAARDRLAAFPETEDVTLLLDLCNVLESQASAMGSIPRGVSG